MFISGKMRYDSKTVSENIQEIKKRRCGSIKCEATGSSMGQKHLPRTP